MIDHASCTLSNIPDESRIISNIPEDSRMHELKGVFRSQLMYPSAHLLPRFPGGKTNFISQNVLINEFCKVNSSIKLLTSYFK